MVGKEPHCTNFTFRLENEVLLPELQVQFLIHLAADYNRRSRLPYSDTTWPGPSGPINHRNEIAHVKTKRDRQ